MREKACPTRYVSTRVKDSPCMNTMNSMYELLEHLTVTQSGGARAVAVEFTLQMSLAARVCACCCGTKERYTLASATSPSIMRRARDDEFTLDDAFELESDLEDDFNDYPIPPPHPHASVAHSSRGTNGRRTDFLVRRPREQRPDRR